MLIRAAVLILCIASAAFAQQPATTPPAAAEKPAAAPADKPAATPEKPAAETAAPAVSADGKMHLDAAVAFLKAWGKGRWDDAKPVAADKVAVKIGDKSYEVDVAGAKSDVKVLLPFRGLSTVREDGKVVAITVNELALQADGAERRGKARLTTQDEAGLVRVTAVEAQ